MFNALRHAAKRFMSPAIIPTTHATNDESDYIQHLRKNPHLINLPAELLPNHVSKLPPLYRSYEHITKSRVMFNAPIITSEDGKTYTTTVQGKNGKTYAVHFYHRVFEQLSRANLDNIINVTMITKWSENPKTRNNPPSILIANIETLIATTPKHTA